MNQQPDPMLSEERLRRAARAFPYPPTPDIAGRVRGSLAGRVRAGRSLPSRARSRLAWIGLAVLLLLGISLVAVPEVQALARALLRLGSVEIVLATPTPSPAAGPALTATPTAGPATHAPRHTSVPSSPTAQLPLNLVGETTLEAAQQQVSFPLQLPAYPPGLGRPDRVFVQDLDGPAVILGWLAPGHPDQLKMSLSLLTSDTVARKTVDGQTILQETTVNGGPAIWLRGPHILQFYGRDGQVQFGPRQLVGGNVLVWQEGEITYRLEVQSSVSLQDAARTAASLAPVPDLPTPGPGPSLAALAGETTLAEARSRVRYPIRLPSYPPGLGAPDRVYLQYLDEPVVILAWARADNPDRARLSLWLLPTDAMAQKTVQDVTTLQETSVDGKRALWINGPHVLRLKATGGGFGWGADRLVEGNVLVWQDTGLTYRLETTAGIAEALRVAGSLR